MLQRPTSMRTLGSISISTPMLVRLRSPPEMPLRKKPPAGREKRAMGRLQKLIAPLALQPRPQATLPPSAPHR